MLPAHISFDFWNTLVQPNTQYADERTRYLSNFAGIERSKAQQIYSRVKLRLDTLASKHCIAYTTDEAYSMLVTELGIQRPDPWDPIENNVRTELETLFRLYPPRVHDITINVMRDIQRRYGITYNVLSNTNFISGRILRQFLETTFVDVEFKFMLFSDLAVMCKPDWQFFKRMIDQSGVSPNQIIHIGDDLTCDIDGASLVGVRSRRITDPIQLGSVLTSLVGS